MSVDLRTVDEIVQKVMDQLRSSAKSATPSSAPVSAPAVITPIPPANERLVLSERVITGAILEERLSREKILVIAPRAIVTPTAQDILRQREIRLVREGGAKESSASQGKWKILLSAATPEAQRAAGDLLNKGEIASREVVACTQDAIKQAVTALSRAEVDGIVGFVREPIRAAAQANQSGKIRAAAIANVSMLDEARTELSPNLIWINPQKRSWFELKTLLSACVGGGKPTLPKGWKE